MSIREAIIRRVERAGMSSGYSNCEAEQRKLAQWWRRNLHKYVK